MIEDSALAGVSVECFLNFGSSQSISGGRPYATVTTVPAMIEYHLADVQSGRLALVVSRPISKEDENIMPEPIKIMIAV